MERTIVETSGQDAIAKRKKILASRSSLVRHGTKEKTWVDGCGALQCTRLTCLQDCDENQVLVGYGARKRIGLSKVKFPDPKLFEKDVDVGLPVPKRADSSACVLVGPTAGTPLQSVKSCTNGGRFIVGSDSSGGGFCGTISEDILDVLEATNDVIEEKEDGSSSEEKPPPNKRAHREEDLGNENEFGQFTRFKGEQFCVPGWSGASFPIQDGPTAPCKFVVSSTYGLCTRLFDSATGQVISQYGHELNPTAVTFYDENCVCVAEWGSLTFYDTRTSRAFGDLRSDPTRDVIYGLDCNAGYLGFTGESRMVKLYDVRKLEIKNLITWKAASKHECIGLEINENGTCFVLGLDHELQAVEIGDLVLLRQSSQTTDTNGKSANKYREQMNKVPQSLPEGSLLHQNHHSFRSEATWSGFHSLPGINKQSARFVAMDNGGIIYTGHFL